MTFLECYPQLQALQNIYTHIYIDVYVRHMDMADTQTYGYVCIHICIWHVCMSDIYTSMHMSEYMYSIA